MSLRFFLLVFLSTIVYSCEVDRLLNQSESLIQDSPEQAIEQLQLLGTKKKTPQQNARLALLMTEALDKNYVDISSDSLIRIAVDYYKNSSNRLLRMKANYYEGIVLRNAKAYSSSVLHFENAHKDALKLSDYFYLGQIHRALADIMNATNNNTEAIRYGKKAIKYYSMAGKEVYEQYSRLSLAISYANDKQYLKCLSLVDSLLNESVNYSFLGQCQLLKAEILIESDCDDYSVPVNLYRTIPQRLFYLTDYGYYSYALERMGLRDSSDYYIQKAYSVSTDQADSATVRYFQARIEKNRKNYIKALSLLEDAVTVQDSLTHELLRQSVSVAQRDFFNKEAMYQELRAKNATLKLGLIIILLLFIVILCIVHIIFRKKKTESILKEQMAGLSLERQNNREMMEGNALIIGALFRERFKSLDDLASKYFQSETDDDKEQLLKAYKKTCASIRKDEQMFIQLESDLNKYCNGIIEKLRTDVPKIKGEHIREISLFFSGFPIVSVQLLMGKQSLKAVEMDRSRYRKLIRESDSTHKELFLKLLERKKRPVRES